jgi:hypothetical protein
VSERPAELVWNKGIARLCDHRLPDEFPDGLTYRSVPTLAGAAISPDLPSDVIADPGRYAAVKDGDLVWVRLSWLPSFVRQVLPAVRARFVLATADSDSSVPSDLPRELAQAILGSPKVIRWFTQNHDGTASERISPLPIGIDFHSVAERSIWGEEIASASRQEATLLAIARSLPPLARRVPAVYLDFDPSRRVSAPAAARLFESRRTIAKRLRRRQGIVCQEGTLPRGEMWRRRGQYAAVLSPHGNGLDCHRTWEALALGHLLVVPASPLDPLFEGLPVVAVRRWDDVTAGNLARWLLQAATATPSPAGPLSSRYWVERMRTVTVSS